MLGHYLNDDEYVKLQSYLNGHPDAGVIVPGSGGVRKLRWGVEGGGKRGGLRIIYFVRGAREEIWLLTLYGKNVRENIPRHVLKQLKEAIEDAQDD
jgi:hypothetical protein